MSFAPARLIAVALFGTHGRPESYEWVTRGVSFRSESDAWRYAREMAEWDEDMRPYLDSPP